MPKKIVHITFFPYMPDAKLGERQEKTGSHSSKNETAPFCFVLFCFIFPRVVTQVVIIS